MSVPVLIVGAKATINRGVLEGVEGLVVGYDSEVAEVELEMEEGTYVTTSATNISQ